MFLESWCPCCQYIRGFCFLSLYDKNKECIVCKLVHHITFNLIHVVLPVKIAPWKSALSSLCANCGGSCAACSRRSFIYPSQSWWRGTKLLYLMAAGSRSYTFSSRRSRALSGRFLGCRFGFSFLAVILIPSRNIGRICFMAVSAAVLSVMNSPTKDLTGSYKIISEFQS